MKVCRPMVFRRSRGFTLVEMAMVMMIVSLLLAGLLPMITSQVDQQKYSQTRKQLEEIKEALIGYAIINGRLPCPASDTSNGIESFASGSNASDGICSNFYNGFVPAATLGISSAPDNVGNQGYAVDAWGYRVRYAITKWTTYAYTKTDGIKTVGISSLNNNTTSYLLVCTTSTGVNNATPSCGATGSSLTPTGIPLVIFSTGSNGDSGTSADELQNVSNQKILISHDTVKDGFDDVLTWLSPSTLVNRMVSAGKLP